MQKRWTFTERRGDPAYELGFAIGSKIRVRLFELRSWFRNFFCRMRQA